MRHYFLCLCVGLCVPLLGCHYTCCNGIESPRVPYPDTLQAVASTPIEATSVPVNAVTTQPIDKTDIITEGTAAVETPVQPPIETPVTQPPIETPVQPPIETQPLIETPVTQPPIETAQPMSIEVPGLQSQQFDIDDPVDVGEKTTYVLEVWTNGPKNAMNVKVTDILPAGTTFVSAKVEGIEDTSIEYKVDGGRIEFDAIPTLEPQKKVSFKITVQVEKAGDLVNTFEIQSNEFIKPIIKQEGTKAILK